MYIVKGARRRPSWSTLETVELFTSLVLLKVHRPHRRISRHPSRNSNWLWRRTSQRPMSISATWWPAPWKEVVMATHSNRLISPSCVNSIAGITTEPRNRKKKKEKDSRLHLSLVCPWKGKRKTNWLICKCFYTLYIVHRNWNWNINYSFFIYYYRYKNARLLLRPSDLFQEDQFLVLINFDSTHTHTADFLSIYYYVIRSVYTIHYTTLKHIRVCCRHH